MAASLITPDDINYLAKQTDSQINIIIAGMTSLIQDNENKARALQNQTWFQRMCKTLNGKNKMTEAEIKQNHDRLNIYLSEALTELYNRNCIDHRILVSLGNQINEVYASQVQLKQMLGLFVAKLNEKIESIDNFHMLCSEIGQGLYSDDASIISICRVLSCLDSRSIADSRKMDIIERDLTKQGIISTDESSIRSYIEDVLNLDDSKVGLLYLELGNLRGNIIADIMAKIIEDYHFLTSMERKMIKKTAIIDAVLDYFQIDERVALSTAEIYNEFIQVKIERLVDVQTEQISDNTLQADRPDGDGTELVALTDAWLNILDYLKEYFVCEIERLGEDVDFSNNKEAQRYQAFVLAAAEAMLDENEELGGLSARDLMVSIDTSIVGIKEGIEESGNSYQLASTDIAVAFDDMIDAIKEAFEGFNELLDSGMGELFSASMINIQVSAFNLQLTLAKKIIEGLKEYVISNM